MRHVFLILVPLVAAGCAANAYHADPYHPPAETVYAANQRCAWASVRVEPNPAGLAAIAGGITGGAGAGMAAAISAPNPQLERWNACMAEAGWLPN